MFELLSLFVAKTGMVLFKKVGLADHIRLGGLVWGDGVWQADLLTAFSF